MGVHGIMHRSAPTSSRTTQDMLKSRLRNARVSTTCPRAFPRSDKCSARK